MASLLTYGAGAAGGLEAVLDRQYKQLVEDRLLAAQQEVARHNESAEGIDREQLRETSKLRQLQQQSLDDDRKARQEATMRDDIRFGAAMRQPGATVTMDERAREMGAGIPSGMYKGGAMGHLTGEEQGPVQTEDFTWAGKPTGGSTGQTQPIRITLNGKEELAQSTPEGRIILRGKDVTDEPGIKGFTTPDRVWMQVQDASGNTVLKPRSGLTPGEQAPLSGTEREQVRGMDYLNTLMGEVKTLGDQGGWAGVGAIKGPAQNFFHGKLGWDVGGEGDAGIQMRAKISQLKTEASFARGGKQLTPTEQAALDDFLATVDVDPHAAYLKLEQFMKSNAQRRAQYIQGSQAAPGGSSVNQGNKKVIRYDMNGNPIKPNE